MKRLSILIWLIVFGAIFSNIVYADNSRFYGTFELTFFDCDGTISLTSLTIGNDDSKSEETNYFYLPLTGTYFTYSGYDIEGDYYDTIVGISGNTIYLYEEGSWPNPYTPDYEWITDFRFDFSTAYDSIYLTGETLESDAENCSGSVHANGVLSGLNIYYVPTFKPQPNHWSGLGIANLSSTNSATVTVTIYSQSGVILATETKPIVANGQDNFLVGTSLTSNGWIKISSDQQLAGLNFLGEYEGSSTDYYMADVPFTETLSPSLVIPHVAQNPTWDTSVCIANPNASAASVTLTYISKSGVASTPYVISIPADGSKEISVSTIANSNSIKGGRVTISSFQRLAAFALYDNLKTGNYSYAGINAVDVSN